MDVFKGISASPGISIGQAYVSISDSLSSIPRYTVPSSRHEAELARFDMAIAHACREIEHLIDHQVSDDSELAILKTHIDMMRDDVFRLTVEARIKEHSLNIEWIVNEYLSELAAQLTAATSEESYLRERTADFYDISRRILEHLLFRNTRSFNLRDESILVCRDLTPSELIAMEKSKLCGIVLETGGVHSHTAILARAFEIPCIVGVQEIIIRVRTGNKLIIDGKKGKAILNPDKKTELQYQSKREENLRRKQLGLEIVRLPSQTLDGDAVSLQANIEIPEEAEKALQLGAEGIGLYRSEFLFMNKDEWPDEELQYQSYRRVLEMMQGREVTIRTLDIGGDKLSPGVRELNPILGWRAIRFSLAHREMFCTQLRALYRASAHGKLRILLPLISGPTEVHHAQQAMNEVKEQLSKEHISFAQEVPIGIMIEVPSAAILSDQLATQVDFFSIGTNDLVQYTLAVDRANEYVAYLYDYFHPSVLRLLKIIVDNAHASGINVAMCGEMAGDQQAIAVLLGLGVDEFSVNYSALPAVKRIIRLLDKKHIDYITAQVLQLSHAHEVRKTLNEFSQRLTHALQ